MISALQKLTHADMGDWVGAPKTVYKWDDVIYEPLVVIHRIFLTGAKY